MTLVISAPCIDVKDGACTAVCPVDCIYEGGRMFYIHPDECVECGLCESICPVDAIAYDDELPEAMLGFAAANRDYFTQSGLGSPGGWSLAQSTTFDAPLVRDWPPSPVTATDSGHHAASQQSWNSHCSAAPVQDKACPAKGV